MRDNLAKEVKEARAESNEKKEQSETLGSKLRDVVGISGGTEQLKYQAQRLKQDSVDRLRKGKYEIGRFTEEQVQEKVFGPLNFGEVPDPTVFAFAIRSEKFQGELLSILNSSLEKGVGKELVGLILNNYGQFRNFWKERPVTQTKLVTRLLGAVASHERLALMSDLESHLPALEKNLEDGKTDGLLKAFEALLEYPQNKIRFRDLITKDIESSKYKTIWLCNGGEGEFHNLVYEVVHHYIKQTYGITIDPKKDWGMDQDVVHKAINGLETLRQLEAAHPNSPKLLYDQFGIKEFYRYPVEMLIAQCEQVNEDIPYGIVIYPRADHNGAFDDTIKNFVTLYQETKDKYAIRVFESESKIDMARAMLKLKHKYDHKASFLILGAHGMWGQIMNFGGKEGRGTLSSDMMSKPAMQRMKDFFVEEPSVVLVSCTTGEEKGLAQTMSQEFPGAKIHAPNVATSLESIHAKIDEHGIDFDVEYSHQGSKRAYLGGSNI